MDQDRPFSDDYCQNVDLILRGFFPGGDNSYLIWRARTHVHTCISCQQRHPNAITFLSAQIRQLETALALKVDEIRGDHMREVSAIGRGAILARPSGAILPLDDVLLGRSFAFDEEAAFERETALALITSLAEAGRRIKDALATIHGEGMAVFSVVPNLNDEDEEFAWKECAGLIRQLSKESREFAFSAALAAELLPDLGVPDSEVSGVHLGVLYKAIQAAAGRYIEIYLAVLPTLELHTQPPRNITELLPQMRNLDSKDESQTESVLSGQTAMMGSLTEIEKAVRELLDKTSDAAKNVCEATLRDALGSQFDELAESTRSFLRTAEYAYTQFPTDLDFSLVIVSLMKAFEVEFHRAIQPFAECLEQIAIRDVSFIGEISTATLGGFDKLFRKNQPTVEPLFRKHGLECERVRRAISQVNKEKLAKHSRKLSKADATRFRTLFLEKPSILAALCPGR